MNIWQILGIDPTDDVAQIRRAYAQKLKLHRPDSDPQGYQQLREAFEQAKALAESGLLASEKWRSDEAEISTQAVALDKTEVIFPRTEPELSVEPATGNISDAGPVWSAQEITTLVSELMESEVRGAGMLETLWRRVARNGSLAQQQLFHQELARTLAEQPGLTEGLLESVSARLGWGLDEYEPARVLGPQIVAALEAQLRETEIARGWKQLQVESESGGFLQRISSRLLQSERRSAPFWMRLVPGLVQETTQQVNRLSHYYPELLDRLNPALVNFVLQPRLALSWAGVFLSLFWGAIFLLILPAPGVQPRGVVVMAAVVFFWLFGRDALLLGLSRWSWWLSHYLSLEFICSILAALMGLTLIFCVAWGIISAENANGRLLLAGSVLVITLLIYWLCWPKDEMVVRMPGATLGRIFASPWWLLQRLGLSLPGLVIMPLYFLLCFNVTLALVREIAAG